MTASSASTFTTLPSFAITLADWVSDSTRDTELVAAGCPPPAGSRPRAHGRQPFCVHPMRAGIRHRRSADRAIGAAMRASAQRSEDALNEAIAVHPLVRISASSCSSPRPVRSPDAPSRAVDATLSPRQELRSPRRLHLPHSGRYSIPTFGGPLRSGSTPLFDETMSQDRNPLLTETSCGRYGAYVRASEPLARGSTSSTSSRVTAMAWLLALRASCRLRGSLGIEPILREIIAGIREGAPIFRIAVRLSAFDTITYEPTSTRGPPHHAGVPILVGTGRSGHTRSMSRRLLASCASVGEWCQSPARPYSPPLPDTDRAAPGSATSPGERCAAWRPPRVTASLSRPFRFALRGLRYAICSSSSPRRASRVRRTRSTDRIGRSISHRPSPCLDAAAGDGVRPQLLLILRCHKLVSRRPTRARALRAFSPLVLPSRIYSECCQSTGAHRMTSHDPKNPRLAAGRGIDRVADRWLTCQGGSMKQTSLSTVGGALAVVALVSRSPSPTTPRAANVEIHQAPRHVCTRLSDMRPSAALGNSIPGGGRS